MKYTSWKYWHSPTNHAKALAIATDHNIYLEIAEGSYDPQMKLKDPVDFLF